MRFKLEFHPLARIDLIEASFWYETQQRGLGARMEEEARQAFQILAEGALQYSVRFHGVRRINLRSFPHGVFYFVDSQVAVVLAVIHGARDSQQELERRRASYSAKQ